MSGELSHKYINMAYIPMPNLDIFHSQLHELQNLQIPPEKKQNPPEKSEIKELEK